MSSKRPYKHILKNLFHQQAEELMPLLMPSFQVEEAFDVKMPELRSTRVEVEPGEFEQGLVQLAVPGAKVTGVYQTEWIEHVSILRLSLHTLPIPTGHTCPHTTRVSGARLARIQF